MISTQHLTQIDLDAYNDNQLDPSRRMAMEDHLALCDTCRLGLAQDQKLDLALRALPRENPPPDLAALIITAVEWRAGQEEQRHARMPLVAIATIFSALLAFWFGIETVIAIQENGVLDFWALFTTNAEISFSPEALLALIESFPLGETVLMLLAVFTALVLGQNLIESIRPRAIGLL